MPPCCFHTETIQQNCLHAKPQNKSNCLPHQTHTNKSSKLCTNLTSLSHLNHIAKPPPHQTLNPKFSAFSLNPNFIAFFLNPKLNHFQMRRTLCEHMNTKHISKSLPSCEPFDQETTSTPSTSLKLPFLCTIPTTQKSMRGPYIPLWDQQQGPTNSLSGKRNFSRSLIGSVGVGTNQAICVRVDNFVTWC